MAWARLDDSYPDHPKVIGLSDAAFRLHTSAICYSSRLLTNGFLPAVWLNGHAKQVKELVSAGLVDDTPDGFRLHDYNDYQPTRQQILDRRESKMRAGVAGADARWHGHNKKDSTLPSPCHDSANANSMAPANATVMLPSPPIPLPIEEKRERAPRFAPPSLDQVKDQALIMGYQDFNARAFFDFYESKGWVVGKSPMRSWKAAMSSWAARDASKKPVTPPSPPLDGPYTHAGMLKHPEGWKPQDESTLASQGVDLDALKRAIEAEK